MTIQGMVRIKDSEVKAITKPAVLSSRKHPHAS